MQHCVYCIFGLEGKGVREEEEEEAVDKGFSNYCMHFEASKVKLLKIVEYSFKYVKATLLKEIYMHFYWLTLEIVSQFWNFQKYRRQLSLKIAAGIGVTRSE